MYAIYKRDSKQWVFLYSKYINPFYTSWKRSVFNVSKLISKTYKWITIIVRCEITILENICTAVFIYKLYNYITI